MKSVRSDKLFIFGLIACFIYFNSAAFAEEKAAAEKAAEEKVAEEKAPETIEATVRVTCEGLPVKNLSVSFTLVEEFEVKGRTDKKGIVSFRIPPGKYRRGTFSSSSSFGWSEAAMIIAPGGERPFDVRDHFWGSGFFSGRKKSVSLGPENSAVPDIEFIPRFEVLYPVDGSVVKEPLPLFKWESVEGAESYGVFITERTQKGGVRGGKFFLRERDINSTEWKPGEPFFKSGKTYVVVIDAIDREGQTINKSKHAEFTVSTEDVKKPQN